MTSSGTSWSSTSFSNVISSLRAFRAKRVARSRTSRFGEDTALRQRVVEQRSGDIAPFLHVATWDDHDVSGDTQRVEHGSQPHHLIRLARHRRLDHKEVEIAVRASIPTAMRAKEDHFRLARRGVRKKAASTVKDLGCRHSLDATAVEASKRASLEFKPALTRRRSRRLR